MRTPGTAFSEMKNALSCIGQALEQQRAGRPGKSWVTFADTGLEVYLLNDRMVLHPLCW